MTPETPESSLESLFADPCSAELYWESRHLRTHTVAALESLENGRSVWVKGPGGSGRQAFVAHLAFKAANLGLKSS